MAITKSKDKKKQQKVVLTKENPVLSEEEEMRSEETQELSEEEMKACKNGLQEREKKTNKDSCNSTSTMVITVSDRKTSKKRHTWE